MKVGGYALECVYRYVTMDKTSHLSYVILLRGIRAFPAAKVNL